MRPSFTLRAQLAAANKPKVTDPLGLLEPGCKYLRAEIMERFRAAGLGDSEAQAALRFGLRTGAIFREGVPRQYRYWRA